MKTFCSGTIDSYEKDAFKKGHRFVAGVDESGRGPLAGPVVAAAVIFPEPPRDAGIKDSKTLTPSKREAIVLSIYRQALSIGVGVVWPEEIDRLNIHRASMVAMEKAVASLGPVAPDLLLIDGPFPIDSLVPQIPIVSGDSKSVSIAAASIVAKTFRDRLMRAYHRLYPDFNFIKNKGYGTEEHMIAINSKGPCPIHRRSFRGVF